MTPGDKAFAEMAALIRVERNRVKKTIENHISPGMWGSNSHALLQGQVDGMTTVLSLIDPEPYK